MKNFERIYLIKASWYAKISFTKSAIFNSSFSTNTKLLTIFMRSKNSLKAGLFFGLLMALFHIIKSLFTLNEFTLKSITVKIVAGLFSGLISGLLFGLFIKFFTRSNFVERTTQIELAPGETIVFETLANHFKGIEGVGGKLYLTSERLVFQSHKFNFQNHQFSTSLSHIKSVRPYKTLGLINNGLQVVTDNNKTEKFVVSERNQWLAHLINYYPATSLSS